MSFLDTIRAEAEKGATILAQDWIKQQIEANRPQVQVAPQPAATLPADVVQVQQNKSSLVMYLAIGAAIIGAAFLLFGRKSKK